MNGTIRFGNTRKAFGEELVQLARDGYDVMAVAADTSKSMQLDGLEKEFPQRCIEVGIAEQNMIMIAAGLASCGKIVFATSYSVFTSMRALEQFRTFVAYPHLNVKVVAGLGGLTAGIEGVTHIAMEDLGIIRAIPEVTLVNVADAVSTKRAIREAAKHQGPVYIRIGRDDSPDIFDEEYVLTLGKANVLEDDGNDVAILASGSILCQAFQSVHRLRKEGIAAKLVEIHTLKPMDEETVVKIAGLTKAVVTVEEHNLIGGLGSAVAEILVRRCPCAMEQVAFPDKFGESGDPNELRDFYGLTIENIVEKVKIVLARKIG